MIKIINGNVFDSDAQVIVHQVNCQGVMGSGVALQVREKFPNVYKEYKLYCNKTRNQLGELLGDVLLVDKNGGVWNYGEVDIVTCSYPFIANIFGQDKYGYNGEKYTDIKALRQGMSTLAFVASIHNWKIAMPYNIGCDRGGANWEEVYTIIEEVFAYNEVELWKYTN